MNESPQELHPVDPNLRYVWLIGLLWLLVPGIIAVVFIAIYLPVWVAVAAGAVVVVGVAWAAIVCVRQVGRLGYLLREHDLLIERGIVFHRTTIVPLARLQFVDVNSGPISRMFGLAEITLHTASAATDATIPGLPTDEAQRLREILAERGENQLAGL